jgi:L-rhamnose mutarotase
MKQLVIVATLLLGLPFILVSAIASRGESPTAPSDGEASTVKRVGMVIGIKPNFIDEYKRLHAAENAGVRDLLRKYHIHNFSIFLQEMPDGKWYEFGYYEYTGKDFEADMAKLAKEPRNIEWLRNCDPMQIPLPGATGWTEMESVYLNP